MVATLDIAGAAVFGYDAVDVKDVIEEADDGTVDIRLSLPRPLMPLFEFLYIKAKYSQSSLS